MKNRFIERIREHVRSPGYRPQNKSEMARDLGIDSKDRAQFREALGELEAAGELVAGRRARYQAPDAPGGGDGVLRGRIRFSRDRKRRSGRFEPEDPASHPAFAGMERPGLFVPAALASTALDGDLVEVRVVRRPPPKWHRHSRRHRERAAVEEEGFQAKVVRVLERGRTSLVGAFHGRGERAALVPEDGRLPGSFRLVEVLPEARSGDLVAAEFVEWRDAHLPPLARMVEVLGRRDDPGVDILAVIRRHGLRTEFPEAALREAEAIAEGIGADEMARREDWRDREVFTIDPEDAKDFDDAVSVEGLPGGGWRLAVHIADVSHYVRTGSALDVEAARRGNSVYLADRVIPMLPEKLSNGVCSLVPGEDRLTRAAVLEFDAQGAERSSRFVSAVIRSRRRFTYEEAMERIRLSATEVEALCGEERDLARHLQRAWRLAAMLRERRFRAGSLDLDFPEVRAVLDDQGRAVGVKRSEYDESHQLIEEFMLAANEAVARTTRDAPAPSLYRIHEDPDPAKLQEFAELARSFGHRVGDVTHRPELQKLLAAIRGRLEEHSLKIALLKSLMRAAYSAEPLGHYGLAKGNYTHFTSPIRRYADLVVHRALRRVLARRGEATAAPDRVPPLAELSAIAAHISETERVAADAENETRQLKLIEYLERLCAGEGGEPVFEASVFEVRPVGAFVELRDLMLRGMIRKDDLPRGDYYYDRPRAELRSRRGGAPDLSPGKVLMVRVVRVDRDRGFVDVVPA